MALFTTKNHPDFRADGHLRRGITNKSPHLTNKSYCLANKLQYLSHKL